MNFDFKKFTEQASARGLRFLLIGGYAVSAHGYSRKTFDVDFLVCRDDSEAWRELLLALDYRCAHEQTAFMQFESASPNAPPLDLMRVSRETFETLFAASDIRSLAGTETRVPSLWHLIALKLHAARDAAPHRRYKDLIDIFYLVDANQVDVLSASFRELCEQYGTSELYEEILRATRRK